MLSPIPSTKIAQDTLKFYLRLFILLAVGVSCFAQPAFAVMVNGKDWRQLTETRNVSYEQLNKIYDNTTGALNGTTTKIGDVDFAGYTWASRDEVRDLFNHYLPGNEFIAYSNMHFTSKKVSQAPVMDFLDDFNHTFLVIHPSCNIFWVGATGWTRHMTGDESIYARVLGSDPPGDEPAQNYGTFGFYNSEIDYKDPNCGAWVYKTLPVPVPTAITLLGLGFLGLAGVSRKKIIHP